MKREGCVSDGRVDGSTHMARDGWRWCISVDEGMKIVLDSSARPTGHYPKIHT